MKNNRGKQHFIFFNLVKVMMLCMLFVMDAEAKDFNYHFTLEKHQPYLKEPVILTLDINQTNKDLVMMFDFDIVKSKEYTYQRLDIKESDTYHNAHLLYTYLLYPLKAGEIHINFKLIQKLATDEGIAYSFSGDRDNVKMLMTKDSKIDLKPLTLHVKPLPLKTQLVGDFTLDYKENSEIPKPYEPVGFSFILKGMGFVPIVQNIFSKELNATIFKEKPLVHSHASLKGSSHTVKYNMAFSHDKSFTREAINIHCFNPKTEKSYILTIPKKDYTIQSIDKNTLLDKTDTPKATDYNYRWIKEWFIYLVIFIAGYMTAMSIRWSKRHTSPSKDILKEKIENTTTPKELLQLLLATDTQKYAESIRILENSIYQDAKINFKQLKGKLCKTSF